MDVARSDELSRRRRMLVLVICSMSLLIVGLDTTIVNVALPSINRSFGASVAGLQWVIDAYTLVLASLLMLCGSTGDRVGRRRTFQTGLVVFSLGSLLCALAPSLDWLIAFRALQAVGGAMLNPVAMSIIRNVFHDPRERALAVGVWGAMFGISIALGPIIGGALVDSVGWRWVFLVNLPVGLAAIVLTAAFVPESRAEHARRIDPVGQVLIVLALASLTYAIIEGGRRGFGSPEILVLFAVSIVSFSALIRYELRRREPLLEVRFFASAPFSGRQRHRRVRVRGHRRLPVPQHAVPPGRARSLAAARRPLHAADGGRHDGHGARIGAPGRQARSAAVVDHRGRRRAASAR